MSDRQMPISESYLFNAGIFRTAETSDKRQQHKSFITIAKVKNEGVQAPRLPYGNNRLLRVKRIGRIKKMETNEKNPHKHLESDKIYLPLHRN